MLPALLEESGSTSRFLRMRERLGMGLFVAICSLALSGCLGCGGERQDEDEPEGEFPVAITGAEFAAKQRLAQTSDLILSVQNTGEETIPDLAVTIFTDANTEVEIGVDEDADPSAEGSSSETQTAPSNDENLDEEVEALLQEELREQEAAEGEETTTEDADTEAEATLEEETLPQADGAFSVISQQPDLAIPSRPVWILEQGYPRLAGTEAGPAPPGELSGTGGAQAVQTNTFSFGAMEPDETREIIWRVTPVQPGTYTVRYRIAAGLQGKAVAVTDDGSVPEGEFVVQITDVPPQTRVNDAGEVVPIQKGDIIGQAGTQQQQGELSP